MIMPSQQSAAASKNNLAIGLQSVPEIRESTPLPLTGTLPPYLNNLTLYRVGPGLYDVAHSDGKPFKIAHWFDGLSLLHSFQIDAESQSVSYKNRYLANDLKRAIEHTPSDKWNSFSFGSMDPCRKMFGRFSQLLAPAPVDPNTNARPKPNIGVTVQTIPGKGLTVRSDMAYNHTLDEKAFDIDQFFGFSQMHNELTGISSAAHGHYDSNTNEFFNYNFDMQRANKITGKVEYSVFKVNATGKTEILAKIVDHPCYIHTITATDNFVILIVWPMVLNPLKTLWLRSIADASAFREDLKTKVYIVPRTGGGVVATYTAEPFFCFHTVNAYEEESEGHTVNVVVDLARYEDASIVFDFKLDKMRSATRLAPSCLLRLQMNGIPLDGRPTDVSSRKAQRAVANVISESDIEFPIVNPTFERRKHRYVYGVTSTDAGIFNAISKIDVDTGNTMIWSADNKVVGEPIFVPDPHGSDEDDGSLLVVVLDAVVKRSSLMLLSAKDLSEIATAAVSQIVPLGFHGLLTKRRDVKRHR